MTLYQDVKSFPYMILKNIPRQKRGRGNPRKKNAKRKNYKDCICAFDIETTNDAAGQCAYLYHWQFAIGTRFVVTGRTWEEFEYFLFKIKKVLDPDECFMIFVHNLSYEFQFLKGIYLFQPEEVFCMDRRKILNCKMGNHFEFRCSYLQTNMSLKEFTSKFHAEHQKLSGDDYNYDRMRYPWTELTEEELEYCLHDVLGLVEAMQNQMTMDGDNLYTLPYTSTGYVRRDVKRAMRSYNNQLLHEMLPDPYIFRMLREAFRGGNTHANRYYAGQILDGVKSADRKSSYPDEQLNRMMPMGPWLLEEEPSIERVQRKLYVQKRAVLLRICLWDVELKDPGWGCPYLSISKCRKLGHHVNDNGRILAAEYLETTVTDVDFEIINAEYKYSNIYILDMASCRYGMLPLPYRKVIQSYFQAKTDLKGLPGQEVYYMKAKNKLNSCYGMSVQDPGKLTIEYRHDDYETEMKTLEEKLDEYNRTAYQSYAWGVWVAAWARYDLELGIRLAHDIGGFVYCDTDSVKYLGDIDLDSYNQKQQKKSFSNGAYAKRKDGQIEYLGVYEHDASYDQFITLGAKKYAFVENGKLGITVSGVSKKKGAAELQELGGLKAFTPETVFRKSAGLEAKYNDVTGGYYIQREGKDIYVSSNVYLHPGEYTLGITGDYLRILRNPKIYLELIGKGLTAE